MTGHEASSSLARLNELIGQLREVETTPTIAEMDDITAKLLAAESARLTAERALQTERARFSAIFYTAPTAIVGISRDGNVIAWNEKAERIFGWTLADALGRDVAELIIPDRLRERHRAALQRVIETGQSELFYRTVRTCALRLDRSEFPVELTLGPAPDSGVYCFFSHIRDLTEPAVVVEIA